MLFSVVTSCPSCTPQFWRDKPRAVTRYYEMDVGMMPQPLVPSVKHACTCGLNSHVLLDLGLEHFPFDQLARLVQPSRSSSTGTLRAIQPNQGTLDLSTQTSEVLGHIRLGVTPNDPENRKRICTAVGSAAV